MRGGHTYEPGRGWDTWNLIVTIGVFFQAAGILVFLGNLLWSYYRGKAAGTIPGCLTLEWSTGSPPPAYNSRSFQPSEPPARSGTSKHPDDPDWKYE